MISMKSIFHSLKIIIITTTEVGKMGTIIELMVALLPTRLRNNKIRHVALQLKGLFRSRAKGSGNNE